MMSLVTWAQHSEILEITLWFYRQFYEYTFQSPVIALKQKHQKKKKKKNARCAGGLKILGFTIDCTGCKSYNDFVNIY